MTGEILLAGMYLGLGYMAVGGLYMVGKILWIAFGPAPKEERHF